MVLPDGENFFVAEVPPKKSGPVKHYHASNVNDMARKVAWLDVESGLGNVYYAMASFKQAEYMDGTKKRKRTQENVDKLKCFWIDLDCKGRGDETDYPSQKDAVLDIRRLCEATDLPRPTLVNSGYGIHAYWILTESIDRATWDAAAARFKHTLDTHGIRHDSSCTTDSARVLRPIGTRNKKEGLPDREVTLIGQPAPPTTLELFLSKMAAMPFMSHGQYSAADLAINDAAVAAVEFRPSSVKEILKECGLLREVGKVNGNVHEPLWHKVIGLVKHTVEGAQAIHYFSKGHPDYSPEDTEAKAAAWRAGPSSCKVLCDNSPAEMKQQCAQCKHNGTITSPIVLGYPKILMTETVSTIVANKLTTAVVEVPSIPPALQNQFKWENDKLWRLVADKEASKESGQDVTKWVPFCAFYFYPLSYYDDEEMKHRMVWRLREREGVYREFVLTGGAMGAGGQALFKELGEQGVTAMTNAKPHMEAYITKMMIEAKKRAPNTITYTHFGWNGNDFLIGDTLIKRGTGEHCKVRLGGSAAELARYFQPSGTSAEWAKLIKKAYDYPGQEQYQFVLGTGFGSPLIHLMGHRGGAVVSAISDASGRGKSTAGMLATGIYGAARSGELTMTREQATDKAIFTMAGILHSLPVMVDEMTNVLPLTASNIIYTFSQGSGRIVLKQDGSLNLGRHDWAAIMNISANRHMSGLISSAKPGAEAELARLIEFECEDVSKLDKETADAIFEKLFDCHTTVGLEYMTWVQQNIDEVKEMLRKVQVVVDKKLSLEKRDRFWSYSITAIITGLMIARRLGFVDFDIANILKWIEARVVDIRSNVADTVSTPEQLFSSMLSALAPGFIITDIEGDRRSNVTPTIIREPKPPYTGRVIVTTQRLYLPQPFYNDWCAENQVGARSLIKAMVNRGWVLNNGAATPKMLAKGTHFVMGQFRCYEVDLTMLESSQELAPNFSNVVSLFKDKTKTA